MTEKKPEADPARARLRAAFVGSALAWFFAFFSWPKAFFALGVQHYGAWFLDLYAILASNDAVTAGLDPYAANPLDVFGRPHVYSHWWLHLRDLGLTRAHTFALGLVIVVAFVATALAVLRPRTWREAVLFLFVIGAPGVLLGIDRANNDLVIFLVLAPVVPCLLSPRRWVRHFSVVLVAMAAALKFYPAVAALLLLLVGDPREIRFRLLLAVPVLGFVGVDMAYDLAIVGPLFPRAEGLTTFGAENLFESLGLGHAGMIVAFVGVTAVVAAIVFRTRCFEGVRVAGEDRATWLGFALGAALLTACFFAGTNYAYRWIFALWMAPLLWRVPHDFNQPLGVRRLVRVTRALLFFALWADAVGGAFLIALARRLDGATIVRLADNYMRCEQPVTWALFICLIAFLVFFVERGVRVLLGRVTSALPPAR